MLQYVHCPIFSPFWQPLLHYHSSQINPSNTRLLHLGYWSNNPIRRNKKTLVKSNFYFLPCGGGDSKIAPYCYGFFGICCCCCFCCCFVALRPKSTAMVIAGRSVHLTTYFSWASLNKQLNSNRAHTFACN